MSPPRVLLYSHDGFGLGHLRRNLNLSARLTREISGASALLIAGFSGIPGVEMPDGVDVVKLPSLRKVGTGRWAPRSLRLDARRIATVRRSIIEATFTSFAPDLVVVDYMPAGVWGELVPALSMAREAGARIVLGLRDILDAPDVTRRTWAESGQGEALARFYDRVLVYGSREVFDADAAYGLSDHLPGRVEHVGYLCAGPNDDDVDLRERLGVLPEQRLVVLTAGGGGDAFEMMSLSLRAMQRLEDPASVHVFAITGPLMAVADVVKIEALASGMSARVRRSAHDLPALLGAADLVITMGAYNTLAESIRLGSRVLSIPRRGPSAEQRMRSETFARMGLIDVMPDDSTPDAIARRVERLLTSTPPRSALDFGGLDRAVKRLSALVSGSDRTQRRNPRNGDDGVASGHGG